jgi:hypothetical protein
MRNLEALKPTFEQALLDALNGLRNRKSDVRKHRYALDGYRTAGEHQLGGPKFITANL